MASPSASFPPVSHGSDGSCSWLVVASAVFVPRSSSWIPLSSPLQPPRSLFLSPPFLVHLAVAPTASLVFPLPALSFARLDPDLNFASSPSSDSEAPLARATTLFAGFHHGPSDQTHKLALQFSCASHLFQFLEKAANFGATCSPRLTHHLSLFLSLSPSDRNRHANFDINPASRDREGDLEPLPSWDCTSPCAPRAVQETADECRVAREEQDAPLATPGSPSLRQPEPELGTKARDVINTDASKDLHSCDLRSELLDCLLNSSFRLLVERVEDLLGEIENPANIDLAEVANFLTLLK